MLAAIFIYWGWDTAVAVNEETEDATRTPGIAAVVSTLLLLGIYILVTLRRDCRPRAEFLVANADEVLNPLGKDVLGSPWDKLLIIAVLTSASASTQTTILPTTRATLSMAAHGAAPKTFADSPAPSDARASRRSATRVSRSSVLSSCTIVLEEHPQRLGHRHRAR